MMHRLLNACSIWISVMFVAAGCGVATARQEIAPPQTPAHAPQTQAAQEDAAPVTPRPHPRVTVYGSPKPLPDGATTHDWKSFLGPTHNAISSETKLLKDWRKGEPRLIWEMAKGTGYTSPAVVGDRLVYLHRLEGEGIAECLHAETGELYWEFRYPTEFEDRFGYNNGPRASPVIDDDHVYLYSAEGKLFCLTLADGKEVWQRDLAQEYRVPQDFFGTSTTPLVEGALLIVNVGAPGGPCVVAFDKRTGKTVWGAGKQWGPSYASPVPATLHGKRRVLVFAGGESKPPTGGLLSIDPQNGNVDFEFPWRSRLFESVNASSPVVLNDRIFISANYQTGSAMLSLSPQFEPKLEWTNKDLGTHWMTAIEKDGYIYGFDGHFEDDASLVCIEVKTGRTVWREVPVWDETLTINGQERRVQVGICRGSLLLVDGHFLCLGEFGHLLWLDLTPQGYKELARTWLFPARETWALPVLSRGLLYVSQNSRGMVNREPTRLLCYDLRASE